MFIKSRRKEGGRRSRGGGKVVKVEEKEQFTERIDKKFEKGV